MPSRRETVILNPLQQNSVIAVAEVCTHCDCSPETARRDLRRSTIRMLVLSLWRRLCQLIASIRLLSISGSLRKIGRRFYSGALT